MLELLEQLFRQVRAFMQSERFNRHQVYAQTATHQKSELTGREPLC